MGKLSVSDFLQVVKNTPLVALDLVVKDPNTEKILLGYRKNEPAKNTWFVPGGRIYKNETIEDALRRVLKDELGVGNYEGEYTIVSVSDHIYDTCFYEQDPSYTNTHYIVLGVEVSIPSSKIQYERILEQHTRYEWMTPYQMIHHVDVHINTIKHLQHDGLKGHLTASKRFHIFSFIAHGFNKLVRFFSL